MAAVSIQDANEIIRELESNPDLHALRLHRTNHGDRDTLLRIWRLSVALPSAEFSTLVLTQGNDMEGLAHIHLRHASHFQTAGLVDPLTALDMAITRGQPYYDDSRDAYLYAVLNPAQRCIILLIVFTPRATVLTAYPFRKGQGYMSRIYQALGVADGTLPERDLQMRNTAAERACRKQLRALQWVNTATKISEVYKDSYRLGFAYRTCLAVREPGETGFLHCFADDEEVVPDISEELRRDLILHNVDHEKVFAESDMTTSYNFIRAARMDLAELELAHRLRKELNLDVYVDFGGVDVPVSTRFLREARDFIYDDLFGEMRLIESDDVPINLDFSSSPRKIQQ